MPFLYWQIPCSGGYTLHTTWSLSLSLSSSCTHNITIIKGSSKASSTLWILLVINSDCYTFLSSIRNHIPIFLFLYTFFFKFIWMKYWTLWTFGVNPSQARNLGVIWLQKLMSKLVMYTHEILVLAHSLLHLSFNNILNKIVIHIKILLQLWMLDFAFVL